MTHTEYLNKLFEKNGIDIDIRKSVIEPGIEMNTGLEDSPFKLNEPIVSDAGQEDRDRELEDFNVATIIDAIVDIVGYVASQDFILDGVNNRNMFTVNSMDYFVNVPNRKVKVCGNVHALDAKGGKTLLKNFVDIVKGTVNDRLKSAITWEEDFDPKRSNNTESSLLGLDRSKDRSIHFDLVATIGKINDEDINDGSDNE